MEFKITRIYAGPDGQSHFEDIDIAMDQKSGRLITSELLKATGVKFIGVDESLPPRWHNAPRRQYVTWPQCRIELEAGDGTKRVLGPGDWLLAEDTTGTGHIARLMSGRNTHIAVTLD
jgi:hypothetical protein